MRRRKRPDGLICLCLVAALVLPGCASVGVAPRFAPDTPATAAGEAVVFGRILFIGNGRNLYPYESSVGARPDWVLQQQPARECDGKPARGARRFPFLGTDEQGRFRYVVPPGRYGLDQVAPYPFASFIKTHMEFEIPAGGRAYYLGDMVVDTDLASPLLGARFGTEITRLNYFEVVDNFDQEREAFAAEHPRFPPDGIARALMTRSPGCFPRVSEGPAAGVVVPAGSVRFAK